MARPSKYTPDRVKRIVDALKNGATRRAAATYGGINEDTFLLWIKRFSDFSEQVALAEAECEIGMTAVIRKAAIGYTVKKTKTTKVGEVETTVTEEYQEFDWRAALEWVKRRRRDDWGDSIDVRKLDDEQLLRLLAKLDSEEAPAGSGAPAAGGSGAS